MDYRELMAAQDKQHRAHLEEYQAVIGGLLEEVRVLGGRIVQETAQVVKASGREAVVQTQISLDQVAKAAEKIERLAERAMEATSKTTQRSEELLGRMDQASQRMVTSEQAVERSLDALLPKVVSVRESLEKELGDAVKVTAAAEEEIKRMVAAIGTSMTKEIEGEIRTKLDRAAAKAVKRVYTLGSWWDRFTRTGIPIVLGIFAVVSGGLGWWCGKEGTYQKAMETVRANAQVRACAYQFSPDAEGTMQPKRIYLDAPLVWTSAGRFVYMTKNEQGKWVYGKATVEPESLSSAICWDDSNEDRPTIKSYRP